MFTKNLKYYLLITLLYSAYITSAQQSYQSSSSVITIVGDLPATEASVPATPSDPPINNQLSTQNTNIEPTLENGFHMRYEYYPEEELDSAGVNYSYRMSFFGKPNQMKIYKYNAQKRINRWLPHRKKKYRSNLCEHF